MEDTFVLPDELSRAAQLTLEHGSDGVSPSVVELVGNDWALLLLANFRQNESKLVLTMATLRQSLAAERELLEYVLDHIPEIDKGLVRSALEVLISGSL